MQDYEKLGVFYLGKVYDIKGKKTQEELLLYDSKDLVTHAVCVGMTGSGKTGLCIGLIEEAAIDGVPAILIDPKGDLGNLLLTFPNLKAEDFRPWINEDDARQKNLSPDEFAAKQAELWTKGIGGWGQDPERIQRLKDSAEFNIYTPGSQAGIPVSILKSFAAPEAAILEDGDLFQERISTTVTSLLGLVGIDADPVKSREHILLSTILGHTWQEGKDIDLAGLLQQIQAPPVDKIGVLDLESFYPSKDRFELVMALNNLLASPGFSAWLEGEALDIGKILYTPEGKPRISIFSIAHLNDPERMFFVSLLMNQVLGWMRGQSGTNSLRAIVYMDEIFGYLPPTKNPPSKTPMLTMLKQARAFGVAMVLSTQNPADLDYKALSNCGTWFIGRLQAERDKERLLDGLESASDSGFKRSEIEKIVSNLGKRVFMMNNTHEDTPEIFETRWVLSYLRGPLTRDQIKTLMDPIKSASPVKRSSGTTTISSPVPAGAGAESATPPALPPDIKVLYIPVRGSAPSGSSLIYQPGLFGAARITFSDTKNNINENREITHLTPITDNVIPVSWGEAQSCEIPANDLEKSSQGRALFSNLPSAAGQNKNYIKWNKEYATWLYGSETLQVYKSPSLKIISNPGEEKRDFRIRLQQVAREQRDEITETLRDKYANKLATLQERKRRAEQLVEKQKEQAKKAKLDTALNVSSTLLGAFTGRKVLSQSNISKAKSAMKGFTKAADESQDVKRAEETVEAIEQQIVELNAEFEGDIAELEAKTEPLTEELETVELKPRKSDINILLVSLAWVPYWQDKNGERIPAW
ncbi:MAG: hypothetical protein JXA13_13200 [Anaerolineales bacterium]|nr:hypothetical protein [Anaerolineales bacterium]